MSSSESLTDRIEETSYGQEILKYGTDAGFFASGMTLGAGMFKSAATLGAISLYLSRLEENVRERQEENVIDKLLDVDYNLQEEIEAGSIYAGQMEDEDVEMNDSNYEVTE